MSINVKCENCGKEEIVSPSRAKNYITCSRKCFGEYKKNNQNLNVICSICGKKFHMKQSHIDNRKHSICCSRNCSSKWRTRFMVGSNNHQFGLTGDKNSSFKSYTTERHDYLYDYAPEHPFADKNGRVRQHRLIAEKHHKNNPRVAFVKINGEYYIRQDYDVHHIDFSTQNNDPKNLIILTRGQHTSIHNRTREIIRDIKTGRILGMKKTGVLKQDELLGTLEKDNQHLSLQSNLFESSTTNSRDPSGQ